MGRIEIAHFRRTSFSFAGGRQQCTVYVFAVKRCGPRWPVLMLLSRPTVWPGDEVCYLFDCLVIYLLNSVIYFVAVSNARSTEMKALHSAAATALVVVIFLPGQITCQRTAYLYYSSQGQAGDGPGLYVSGR